MQRFYLQNPDFQKDTVTIADPRVVHQCARVLRMRAGSEFSVFDETGKEFKLRALEISSRMILGQILEPLERHTEPGLQVSLYQAIPKKTVLFEWVVEKATELGVAEIFPMVTERTEKRRLSKFERLERIAIEAAEQSGRLRVPVIHHPIAFEAALKQAKNGYLAYEFHEGMQLLDYGKSLKEAGHLALFIGPEGGFSQKEVALAEKMGVRSFSLGPRILRTETAAMASLAQLLPLMDLPRH